MHSLVPDPTEREQLALARKIIHDRCRSERGALEFHAVRAFARTVLKFHEIVTRRRFREGP
jgi:hypothetical protein